MTRYFTFFCGGLMLLMSSACSDNESGKQDAAKESGVSAQTTESDASKQVPVQAESALEKEAGFTLYAEKLARVKVDARKPGQTVLTGGSLVFDYDQQFAQMDSDVEVSDDQGVLQAEHLTGRFNVSNQIETVSAQVDVSLFSQGRTATCDEAVYTYGAGTILLSGRASVSDGTNRLSGEMIRFWSRDSRKVICEPNAILMVSGKSGQSIEGLGGQSFDTEIRAERVVYDEAELRADILGDVRIRDAQANMDCDAVVLHLTKENGIDWIEASGEISMESQGRTAKAEKAYYDYEDGVVILEGRATVSDGTNSLTGEIIRFWSRDSRKVICEPNAVLVVSGEPGQEVGGAGGSFNAEIRAERVVFDEEQHRADLLGNVRIRDLQGAMNCDAVTLHLKDDNKIDWIEARGGVIIQLEDKKALAELAVYDVEEEKFVLEKNPMLKQGPNVVTGDRITFWQESERVLCEPNVHILLYLDEATKAKFMKDLDE